MITFSFDATAVVLARSAQQGGQVLRFLHPWTCVNNSLFKII